MPVVGVLALLCTPLATLVAAHGAVSFPPPRNAVDHDLSPWKDGVPKSVGFIPWCPFPLACHSEQENCAQGNMSATNGQACFWFSNGCGIGCPSCDGSTRGPIPLFVHGKPQVNRSDPALCHKMGFPSNCDPSAKLPVCKNPAKATNCNPQTRTVNRGATCGALRDGWSGAT